MDVMMVFALIAAAYARAAGATAHAASEIGLTVANQFAMAEADPDSFDRIIERIEDLVAQRGGM